MQELQIADGVLPGILNGLARAHFRRGRRDIALGKLRFVTANGKLKHTVTVREVRYKRFADITDEEAQAVGFEDANVARAGMVNHYGKLKAPEEFTVIIW